LNPAGTSTEGLVEPTTLVAAGWLTSSMGAKQGSTSTGLAYDVIMLRHQVRNQANAILFRLITIRFAC
jgi:hypothetical protein